MLEVDEGDDNSGDVATTFRLVTTAVDDGPEEWQVSLINWPDESEPDETDVLASATVYRAHVDQNWFDRLDSVDQDLASVAEDLLDRDMLEEIDEESVYANAIAIVYFVEVREDARGRKLSHELVRSFSRVFGNDIIALQPSRVSHDADGDLLEDQVKHQALIKHWRAMGFVAIPGTDSMMLPLSARLD